MTRFKNICILAILLLASPAAIAAPASQPGAPAIKAPPVTLGAESEDEEDYGPELSDPAKAALALIMTRDVLPIMTSYAMADFIWQADPAAACEAGKAVAAGGARLQASIPGLRQTLIDNGDDVEAVDARMKGMLSSSDSGRKTQARFCDRLVPQNLSAEDKAAFKKGGAMLNVIMTELQEAVAAKIAHDDAKACVSMQVVAATASDFEDFIAAEATTSEVMAVMKRGRVMRMVADMRGMAEDSADGCGDEA